MAKASFESAHAFPLEKECSLGSQVDGGGVQWCPTMDIAAVALVEGRVQLLRFSGVKLWTSITKGDDVQVTALRWRPDGKVLAVAFDIGLVDLLDVETGAVLHSIIVDEGRYSADTHKSNNTNKGSSSPQKVPNSNPSFQTPPRYGSANDLKSESDGKNNTPEIYVTCMDWVIEEGAPSTIISAGQASATALANQALSMAMGGIHADASVTACCCECHSQLFGDRDGEGGGSDNFDNFSDISPTCTRKLPPLFGVCACCTDARYGENDQPVFLDVLVVGLNNGDVEFYGKGLLSLGTVRVCGSGDMTGAVQSVRLRRDMSTLVATVAKIDRRNSGETGSGHGDVTENEILVVVVVDTRGIARRKDVVNSIATAYSHCLALEERAWGIFHSMKRSWEGLVHDFGQRMERYERQQLCPGEDLGTQLLRLLTLGIAPDSLQHLLLHDLNESETRKMATSMEQSYTAILHFAVNPMFSTSLAMLRQAVGLIGFARKKEHTYLRVGVSESMCEEAIDAAVGVCMKTSELIVVVHEARSQFKTFFMWLWVNILKLKDKPVPANYLHHNTEQAVGQFLRSHIKPGKVAGRNTSVENANAQHVQTSRFMEETVGQYFQNENLSIPPTFGDSQKADLFHDVNIDRNDGVDKPSHGIYSEYWASRLAQMERTCAQAQSYAGDHTRGNQDCTTGARACSAGRLRHIYPEVSLCQQLHSLSSSTKNMFAAARTEMSKTYTVQSQTPLCSYDNAMVEWENEATLDSFTRVAFLPLIDSSVTQRSASIVFVAGHREDKSLWIMDVEFESKPHRNRQFSFDASPTLPMGTTTALRLPIGAVNDADEKLCEKHKIIDVQIYDQDNLLILLQIIAQNDDMVDSTTDVYMAMVDMVALRASSHHVPPAVMQLSDFVNEWPLPSYWLSHDVPCKYLRVGGLVTLARPLNMYNASKVYACSSRGVGGVLDSSGHMLWVFSMDGEDNDSDVEDEESDG
eukprot:CFRG6407T1